jgi:uncharacterized protein YwqG
MDELELSQKLQSLEREYAWLELQPGEPGQVPQTKLYGVPWWPAGVPRPQCEAAHDQDFVAQFRLDDIPGRKWPATLLSFHYCMQCSDDGKMAHGWRDDGRQRRYDVRIWKDLGCTPDGLGQTTEGKVTPQIATLHPGVETLNYQDIWRRFPSTAEDRLLSNPIDHDFHDVRSKIGGWPSWVQHPDRPEDDGAITMRFVAQLSGLSCPDSPWNCGYVYFFVSPFDDDQQAEMVLQST